MNNFNQAIKSFLLLAFTFAFIFSIPQTLLAYTPGHYSGTSQYHVNPNPLSLEFVALSQQMKDRRTFEPVGQYNKLDNSLTFSPNEKTDLRLFASYVYESNTNSKDDHYFELTEFMYRRKSLLTQAQHGIKLDLELKTYYVLNSGLRNRWGLNGAFIPQLIIKKRFTSWFSFSTKIRHHFNMTRGDEAYLTKEETRIYLSPTFVFSRKFMFNTTITWKHKNKVAKSRRYADEIDLLEVRPSLMYLFNHSVMGEVYADTTLMRSHDKSFISKTASDSMVYGLGLYFTAF